MGEVYELQQKIPGEESNETNSHETANANQYAKNPQNNKYMRWLRMAIYTLFVLSGQTVATLLGRLYYEKGGNSKWMATLVQTAGFPILIPFLFMSPKTKNQNPENENENENENQKLPSLLVLASLYISLGIFFAAVCMLYSIGLLYLPVSTYSLICASQIAFNAFFSFFLNSQNFTPFIINSLVLLTISSALLVFNSDSSDSNKVSKQKYMIGFVCTVAASAGFALMLSVTQLAFRRILKSATFCVILEMIIYQTMVATCVILVGLFASGEWKGLSKEMGEFELGKWSYLMTLVWSAISWQLFSIGAVGLIFEISSLFSNVISTLGLPIVPVLAVSIFHDKMNGVKIIAMLLAIWGFISYIYQHYLDDLEPEIVSDDGVSKISLVERG